MGRMTFPYLSHNIADFSLVECSKYISVMNSVIKLVFQLRRENEFFSSY